MKGATLSPFRPAFMGRARLAQVQLTPEQMQQYLQQQGQFPGAQGMPAGTPPQQLAQNGMIINVQISNPSGGEPVQVRAMIDTGASITTLNASVAQRAGLQQTGETQLGGVGGMQNSPIYAAKVALSDYGVSLDAVQVATIPDGQLPTDMLIGRDVLQSLTVTYDGPDGTFNVQQTGASPSTPIAANPATPGTVAQPGAPAPQGAANLPQPPAGSFPWLWVGGGVAAAGLVVGGLFLFKVF